MEYDKSETETITESIANLSFRQFVFPNSDQVMKVVSEKSDIEIVRNRLDKIRDRFARLNKPLQVNVEF